MYGSFSQLFFKGHNYVFIVYLRSMSNFLCNHSQLKARVQICKMINIAPIISTETVHAVTAIK